jgi:hypothetical protein
VEELYHEHAEKINSINYSEKVETSLTELQITIETEGQGHGPMHCPMHRPT